MNKNILKEDRGGIGIVLLVLFFILACVGLVIGLVNLSSTDLSSQQNQDAVSVKFTERDFALEEQEEIIATMQQSIEDALADNEALRDQKVQLSQEIADKDDLIVEKDSQIQFLVSARTRLEQSIAEISEQSRIDKAKLEKENSDLSERLEAEQIRAKETEEQWQKKLSKMKDSEKELKNKIAILQQDIISLQTSSLVVETAKMHFNLANHFLKNKEYELAIKEYKRALHLTPEDFDANYNLALIYDIYTDDPLSALDYYKKCLQIDPDFEHKKIIQERIINLSLHDAVSIEPTLATTTDKHRLHLKDVMYKE